MGREKVHLGGPTSVAVRAPVPATPFNNRAMGPPAAPAPKTLTFAQTLNSRPSRAGDNLRQQAAIRHTASRTGNATLPPTHESQYPNKADGNDLAQAMGHMGLGDSTAAGPAHLKAKVYAPSMAPVYSTQSIIVPQLPNWTPSTSVSLVVTMQNKHKRQGWFENDVCITSNFHKGSFQVGDVVSVPYHVANRCPTAQPGIEVNQTKVGPVFSKRRMFIILWHTDEYMFGLPLYSWHQVGISKKTKYIKDYVSVGNYKFKNKFHMTGYHNPIWFVHKRDDSELTSSTTCHITGAHMIAYDEDIGKVGRITEKSYHALLKLWDLRNKEYRSVQGTFPPEGAQDPRWANQQVFQQNNHQANSQANQQGYQQMSQQANSQANQRGYQHINQQANSQAHSQANQQGYQKGYHQMNPPANPLAKSLANQRGYQQMPPRGYQQVQTRQQSRV